MAELTNSQPGFFARLKQHHLCGVVVAYAVVTGFLIQLASRALPAFGWGSAFPAVIIILLLGFPVALVLAWTLIKPKEPTKYTRWQKVHWKFGAILSVSVVAAAVISGFSAWRWEQRHAEHLAAEQIAAQANAKPAAPAFNPPADRIAVLPFNNLSGDPHQQYFSDGITEELTGALGQISALTVIAWDSSSRYRNSNESPRTIGEDLNVATLLHGSIERQGNAVRVMAELVDTRSGTQLWSAHYNDTLANIFQVQDKISAAIAGALKVKFTDLGGARSVNPEAHDLVLRANALLSSNRSAGAFEQAHKLMQRAVDIAPDYAGAHAGLAASWIDLTFYTPLSLKDALPKARVEARKALALDPKNSSALLVLAGADMAENHLAKAKGEFERVLEVDPSNAYAHLDYGLLLPLKQGQAQEQEAVTLDPDNVTAQANLANYELDLGAYPQALAPWQAVMRLDPRSANNVLGLAETYALLNRNVDAAKAFDLAQPKTELDTALVTAGRLAYQSVFDLKLHAQALAAVDKLRARSDLDPNSTGDVIQLYLVLGQRVTAMDMLPKLCAGAPTACNDLSVNPEYLTLRGDPGFMKLVQQYDTVSKPAPSTTSPPAPSP